jgi:capsular exopolysaccharide synthesis family protein
MAIIILMALVAGCGLGGGAAYVVDLLDARIRTLSELRRVLDYYVIGLVPQLPSGQGELAGEVGLISHALPRSALSESYKSVRTNLEFLRRNGDVRVLLVTSPISGDGKSTTASNLAISLAHAGRKVLLIDGDLRRPSLHRIFALRRDSGLAQVLGDRLPLQRAIQPTLVENLDLIAAGPDVTNPAELLTSHRLGEVLDETRRMYDIVIFDSSPLLAVADPSILAVAADRVLLVVRVAATRRQDLDRIGELLATLGTPVIGTVVNAITQGQSGYGYQYGYGSGSYGASSPTMDIETSGSGNHVALTNGRHEMAE